MSEDVLFRDAESVQPPDQYYEDSSKENIYTHVLPSKFIACIEDIWLAKKLEPGHVQDDLQTKQNFRQKADALFKKKALEVLDHGAC